MFFFNPFPLGPAIFLILIPIVLGLWAQHRVGSTYAKWSKVGSRGRLTGAEVADAVMRSGGVEGIEIVEIPGHLTDHYDPGQRRLCLSSENYRGTSLAALGVAAHESGHALQDKVHYPALRLRMGLAPVTNFASSLLGPMMFGGYLFGLFRQTLILGVVIYLILTIFQLVTMPVEFDASKRALQRLNGLGILQADEMVGARETLNAAAWTYVAAFVVSLGYLLYYLLELQGGSRRR